jgi:hypothetical protein
MVVKFMPQPLYPAGKIEQETGWASKTVWTLCRREKALDPAENQVPNCPAHGLVTTLTKLSQIPQNLLYHYM